MPIGERRFANVLQGYDVGASASALITAGSKINMVHHIACYTVLLNALM